MKGVELKNTNEKKTGSPEQSPSSVAKIHSGSINPALFSKRAHKILSDEPYHYYGEYDYDNEEILEDYMDLCWEVKPLLEACDGHNALVMLKAITQPLLDVWPEHEDEGAEGPLQDLLSELSDLFAEAFLSLEMSEDETVSWREQLDEWLAIMKEDDDSKKTFPAMLDALEEGWSHPNLVAKMQGKKSYESLVASEKYTYCTSELEHIRLKILERQGRYEEYLNFAELNDEIISYLKLLIKIGRGKDAVAYAMKEVIYVDFIVPILPMLKEKDLMDEALKLGEYGMSLHGDKKTLARWVRNEARHHAMTELELKAGRTAFHASSCLEDYLAVKEVAGEEWETLKYSLLAEADSNKKSYGSSSGKLEILLHEKMHKEIIDLIDKQRYWSDETLVEVIAAVHHEFPEWAIDQCKKQAEPNLNQGKSQYYLKSMGWIKKAGQIYLAADSKKEWLKYLDGLIDKHNRKNALRAMLESLKKIKK